MTSQSDKRELRRRCPAGLHALPQASETCKLCAADAEVATDSETKCTCSYSRYRDILRRIAPVTPQTPMRELRQITGEFALVATTRESCPAKHPRTELAASFFKLQAAVRTAMAQSGAIVLAACDTAESFPGVSGITCAMAVPAHLVRDYSFPATVTMPSRLQWLYVGVVDVNCKETNGGCGHLVYVRTQAKEQKDTGVCVPMSAIDIVRMKIAFSAPMSGHWHDTYLANGSQFTQAEQTRVEERCLLE